MYEKYYLEIVSAINKKAQPGADIMLIWADVHAPDLYAQERALDDEINKLWDVGTRRTVSLQNVGGNFATFKAKVLAWGRVCLLIYKKFTEDQKT